MAIFVHLAVLVAMTVGGVTAVGGEQEVVPS